MKTKHRKDNATRVGAAGGSASGGTNNSGLEHDEDGFGGCGDEAGFTDVCLVTSLRNLGFDVPYTQSGPFQALTDGNRWLLPLNHFLATVTGVFPEYEGKFVRKQGKHFTAVIATDAGATLIDGDVTSEFYMQQNFGSSSDETWFEVVAIGGDGSGSCYDIQIEHPPPEAEPHLNLLSATEPEVYPDGLCLYHSILASEDLQAWVYANPGGRADAETMARNEKKHRSSAPKLSNLYPPVMLPKLPDCNSHLNMAILTTPPWTTSRKCWVEQS